MILAGPRPAARGGAVLGGRRRDRPRRGAPPLRGHPPLDLRRGQGDSKMKPSWKLMMPLKLNGGQFLLDLLAQSRKICELFEEFSANFVNFWILK